MATPYCDFKHFQCSFSAEGACQKFKKWRGACAESVLKICVSAFFLQKARAETRNGSAGQKYTFTQKTNRKLKLKRTHSWFLHWQKRLVLSVVSSSRNRDFHESIRLNAKVLCLRNSESCNLSRSVHLARRAMYTERSLRAATRFLQQINPTENP